MNLQLPYPESESETETILDTSDVLEFFDDGEFDDVEFDDVKTVETIDEEIDMSLSYPLVLGEEFNDRLRCVFFPSHYSIEVRSEKHNPFAKILRLEKKRKNM